MKIKIVGLGQRRDGVSTVKSGKNKGEERAWDIQDMYFVGERGSVGVIGRTAGKVTISRSEDGLQVPDLNVGDICDVDFETNYRGDKEIAFLEIVTKAAPASAK